MIGKKLRIVLAWWQYQAGVIVPIFENTIQAHSSPSPWMPSRFIPAVRRYLDEVSSDHRNWRNVYSRQNRTKDRISLTEMIALSQNRLKRFNYCRLFVGAMCLSEICKAERGLQRGHTRITSRIQNIIDKAATTEAGQKRWKVYGPRSNIQFDNGGNHNFLIWNWIEYTLMHLLVDL